MNVARFYKPSLTTILTASFFMLFIMLTQCKLYLNEHMSNIRYVINNQFVVGAAKHSLSNILVLVYSSLGLAMLFVFVGMKESKRIVPLSKYLIDVGNLCMGVYLFQQFILVWLYDYTFLPAHLGPILLPWVGFFITLIVSLLLSYFLRLSKVGRFFIG